MRRHGPICLSRSARSRSLLVGILGFSSAAGLVQAGEIFKSTDANGQTVYSDHLDPSLSQSSLVQLDDARFPPAQLHFCWTNCFTLVLNDSVYRRTDGTEESWTVETFSSDAIVLHRHDAPADWNGFKEDVVYAGQVSNDRLINVTVNGKPTSGIDASWGAALNTLPGSNAERDAKPTANLDSSSVGSVSSNAAPPPLPEEEQPSLSEDGALWTPGYWYWRDQAYVWIGGAWARPPRIGVLWTPAYWGTAGTLFVFHPGHWGPTVGSYGGMNYGYGLFWQRLYRRSLDRQFVRVQQRGESRECLCRPSSLRPVVSEPGVSSYCQPQRGAAQRRLHPRGLTTTIEWRTPSTQRPQAAPPTDPPKRRPWPQESNDRHLSPKSRPPALRRNSLMSRQAKSRTNSDRV